MFKAFLEDRFDFVNYSYEHYLALLACLIFSIYFLYSAKVRWSAEQTNKYVIILAALVLFTQLFKICIRLVLGNFNITEDLPFHLCNMMPFFMLFVVITKQRFLWSIFFFWIMAGTLQALFTPTLTDTLPHYEAIRYWVVHAGLPLLAIFCYYIYDWRPTYKDAIRSGIMLNLLALIMYPINNALGANYIYLNAKPAGTTLYSYLCPWPYYILALQVIWISLFCGLVFIFSLITKARKLN